jgi:hypothetical protein
MLRHVISHTQDWSELLPTLEFASNNSINTTTGLKLFQLDLGYHPATPHILTTVESDSELAAVESFVEQALTNQAHERI